MTSRGRGPADSHKLSMNDRRDGKLCPKAACLGKPEKLELTLRPFIFEGKSGRFLLENGLFRLNYDTFLSGEPG